MAQALLGGRVEPVDIQDEIQRSYLDYAMSVIVGRALPDVRDGLKPVHRRILWSMLESGLRPDRPHRKSANVVGGVMSKYHPHGDQAIYDAMARMAQPWSLRSPLIDGHGNFGSPEGDPPAAMRYTEARLAPMAMELLRDIEADTVGKQGIKEAYETGRGSIKMRGVATIEETKQGTPRIVITEVPYQVNPASLLTKVAELRKDGKIREIATDSASKQAIRNESGK